MTPDTPDPDMPDDGHWHRLNAALERLLDAGADERLRLLADMPASLRASATAALDVLDQPDGLDDVAAHAATRHALPQPQSLVGQRIGGFELRRLLGVGGMSWVYVAERDQGGARQQVALKRLQPDLASPRLRDRFLAEQRIVGRLAHPGIARFIAAGVDHDGVPWLATELVDGLPLLQWCDAHRLDVTTRLRLFVQVCDAVGAAHRHLIVHRDLKPANVLVDAEGTPKLLDFGISRLLDDDALRAAPGEEHTRAEWRMLTPEYAAPEQLRGEPPSIAMDIHALGIMLHELLAGARPPRAAVRPSDDAVLRPMSATITHEAAEARSTSQRALRKRLRGDLDAVVHKCIAFSPEQRYARVELLCDDLRAVLDTRPIALRRRHPLYACWRFVQRNALACLLATVALVGSVGGFIGVVLESERREQALERAEAVERFLVGLFGAASLSTHDAAQRPVATLLQDGAKDATALTASQPALAAQLLLTIATAQDQLDQFDAALGNYESAVNAAQAAGDAVAVANAQLGQANVLLRTGSDPERIDALLAAALPVLERHAPDSLALANGLILRALREPDSRGVDAAEATFLQAIALLDRTAPGDPLAFRARSDLGVLYELNGRPDDAVAAAREAWDGAREAIGMAHIVTLRIGFNYAKALGRQGALAEANALMQETARPLIELLPPEHTDQVAIRAEYARVAAQFDRLDEAQLLLTEALALAEARDDISGGLAATVRSHLGALLVRQGDVVAGFDEIDAAYRYFVQQGANDFFQTCWAQGTSARLLFDLGRDDEARARLAAPSNCGNALDEARARAAWANGHREDAHERYAALLVPRDDTPQAAMAQVPIRLRYATLLLDAQAGQAAHAQLETILATCTAAGIHTNPELRQARALLSADMPPDTTSS